MFRKRVGKDYRCLPYEIFFLPSEEVVKLKGHDSH